MKVLVCGGRNFSDKDLLYATLNRVFQQHVPQVITMVIQGGSRGADNLARNWADDMDIHSVEVRALWDSFGKSAGHIRNRVMCDLLTPNDLVVAFPGGAGTKSMIRIARDNNIPVLIVTDEGVVLSD